MFTALTHIFPRARPVLPLALVALVLGACSAVGDMFGNEKDVILPGQRETVIRSGTKLDVSDISKIPVLVPAASVNLEWSQPGGVATNAPLHVSLRGEVKRAWKKGAGRGSSSQGRLTASPIVAQNMIFVLDTEATVRAFRVSDGTKVWTRPLTPENEEEEEGFGGGLAYDAGRLIAATAFGGVVALDPGSGKVLWRKKLGVPLRAAPTASVGRVYVTSVNNQVFALSVADGATIWRFAGVSESAGILSNSSPAVGGGFVVVPYTTGDLIAFHADTGRLAWSDSLTRTGRLSSLSNINDIAGRPVIHNGRAIAISHSGRLAAIDLKTGNRLWSRNFPSTQTPWAAGQYIFFISSFENILMAISSEDGKIRWIKRLGEGLWSGPVLAGGRLIVVSDAGTIVNVSPYTGIEVSRRNIGEKILIPPIVAGNTIYYLTDDADLIAMR
jgi:outer membrane protein assembly factor BamB